MSSIGQVTKESGSNYLRGMRKVRDDLVDTLTHGFMAKESEEKKTNTEPKHAEENKIKYLSELNSLGKFSNLGQVLCAQQVLNQFINGNGEK